MSLFTLTILTLINHVQSVEYKRNLTVRHSRHPNIGVYENPSHVDISNNIWHINPTSQNGYDLELLLENEWTFNPSMKSSLTLTLNGFTPDASIQDGEFILVFSIDNTEYFAVVIRLDIARNTWKYYPQTGDSTSFIMINDIYSNIINDDTNTNKRNRWQRISNSTDLIDNWVDIRPFNKNPLQWPLNIKLTNNPITNTLLYQCYIPNKLLQIEYLRAFSSHKTIQIYILNDADDNKPFDISWIYIQYNDNSTTTKQSDDLMNNMSNISDIQTTINLPTSGPIIKENLPVFPSQTNDKMEIGAMIAIVISVVLVTICIVLLIFFYWKQKEKENDPESLNRSEYHTPKVNMSNTDINKVLEKKRRESQQFAVNNMLKKRKLSQNSLINNSNNGQTTQSIVPIEDSISDLYTSENSENEDDSKFNED